MLHYIKKDISTVTNGIVAHGVNCAGKMNSGVAKAIRNRWPEAYRRFMDHTTAQKPKGRCILGEVDVIRIDGENVVVANCYTQRTYGYDGKKYADLEGITVALQYICQMLDLRILGVLDDLNVSSVYIPRIGCGLGGLSFSTEVQPVLEELALKFPQINIYVCDLPEKTNEPNVT